MKYIPHIVLVFLSWIYITVVALRTAAYRIGLCKIHTLPVPVICVGNITAGGTGKTPALITIARLLCAAGYKPAVITRGYGRKRNAPVVVSNGQSILADVATAGDEAVCIAQKIKGMPIIADTVRYRGGRYAIEQYHPDVLLLDDGFQHFSLSRNVNVVLIDCTSPWGGNAFLPAGRLREPKNALKRAQFILLTRSDQISEMSKRHIREEIHAICGAIPVLESIHKPVRLIQLESKKEEPITWLQGRNIVMAAGIGNNEAFKMTLTQAGAVIQESFLFPDHHQYTEHEMQKIIRLAQEKKCCVLTTTKDAVRILPLSFRKDEWFMLDVECVITRHEDILKKTVLELVS